jgi:hypothetical protein
MMLSDRYFLSIVLCAFCSMLLLIVAGCTEHYNLEQDNSGNRPDFTETIRLPDTPTKVHIIFQPQINSDRYSFGVHFPEFEYDPSNHGMADTTRWFHLIDSMTLSVYDEHDNLLNKRSYNINESNSLGFSHLWQDKKYGTGMGFINQYKFKSDRTYRYIVSFPAIHDPYEKFPEVTLIVRVIEPKFFFELWL